MRRPAALIVFKLVIAQLCFAALVTEIATLVERGVFRPVNFCSYFTVESNVLVFLVLLVSAVATAAGRGGELDALRGAVTVYILVVGLGFSFLLSGLENVKLTAVPWDNVVLHYITPVAVAVDWILDRPRRRLPFGRSLLWLLFPFAYAVYSMTRGAIGGWYPYPFLDPAHHGYAAVAGTIGALIVLGAVLVAVVTRVPSASGGVAVPETGGGRR